MDDAVLRTEFGDEFALVNMSTNGVTSKQLKSKLMNGGVFVAVQARDEMQSLDTENMLPVKGDYNARSKICSQCQLHRH